MLAKVKEIVASQEKYTDSNQIQSIADKVTVAALRYGMLSTDPNKEIIFALDEWLSFEGNTGPYLLYSYARASAVLRKADTSLTGQFSPAKDLDPTIQLLVLELQKFHEQMQGALDNNRLSSFCSYLYGMCRAFNKVYAHVPIHKEEDESQRLFLLEVVSCFRTTIKKGLKLIGIETLEEM
jgi:arginyl-tRNA synthetase